MNEFVIRIFRFGLAGMAGIVIDFGITWLCKEKSRIHKFAANAAGFSVAVISNYTINRLWTFQNNNPAIVQQFTSFLLISMVGLVCNTAILYLLHERKRIPFYPGKLMAIIIVFCWNFTANNYLTFHPN